MHILYSWSIRRSGAAMTITHSCGRVVNVERVEPDTLGKVIAYKATGEAFELYVPGVRLV
jgi:hypothetical protein